MSEQCKIFNCLNGLRQQKRISNIKNSTKLLIKKGIKFESFNNGIHLKVGNYDFYPSTGLYMHKKTKFKKYGIFNLLKDVKNGI